MELDSDEESLRYEADNEAALEDAYQQYLKRQGVREEAAKEKRQRLGKGGELGSDDDSADGDGGDDEGSSDEEGSLDGMGIVEEEEVGERGAGLLVQLDKRRVGVAKGAEAAAAQWFGQEMFDDPNLVEQSEEEEEVEEVEVVGARKRQRTEAAAGRRKQQQEEEEAEEESSEEEGLLVAAARSEMARNKKAIAAGAVNKGGRAASAVAGAVGEENGFEEVPRSDSEASSSGRSSGSDSDSDAGEFDALDDHGKAEVLALAKKMIRRKGREGILDAAYNR